MSNQVILSISNNEGYAADQVRDSMTLVDLRRAIDEAIENFGPDAMIVTEETGNMRGARFGSISTYEDTFSAVEGDEDDEDEFECPKCGSKHDGTTTGTEYCGICE